MDRGACRRGEVYAQHRSCTSSFVDNNLRLASGRALPLNSYDRQTLARLAARRDLPPSLVELVQAMAAEGVKHEQEAWL